MDQNEIEARIRKIYNTAEQEVSDKWFNFMIKNAEANKKLQEKIDKETDPVKKKELEQALQDKIAGQTIRNEQFKALSTEISDRLTNAQKDAAEWVNDQASQLYSLTYNETGTGVMSDVKGYSFQLVDRHTIENIIKNDDAYLLPHATVNDEAAAKYYNKLINSQVTQAIIQGESVDQLAQRIQNVTNSSKKVAVRTARTTFTSAENKGRIDAQKRAEDDGIIVKKKWNCAIWSHNRRDWHADLEGVEKDLDEPFENSEGSLMYPGDPDGSPANVYNCRCTLETVVKGFKNLVTGEMYDLSGNVMYAQVNQNDLPAYENIIFSEDYVGSGTYTAGAVKYAAEYQMDVKQSEVGHLVIGDDFDSFVLSDADKNAYLAQGYKVLEVADKNGVVHYIPLENVANKTKNGKLDTLPATLDKWQKKADSVDNKTYTGIWKDPVEVHDYNAKAASIQAKRDYFNAQLAVETDPYKIAKFQQYLKDLDEFEKLGKEWSAYDAHAKKIQADIDKYTAMFTRPAPAGSMFGPDAYSQARKDAAMWAKSPREADKQLFGPLSDVWVNEATYAEKRALYEYSRSYRKFNQPPRGYDYDTGVFVGVGNADLDTSWHNGNNFNALTDLIDKSSYGFDMWTQRGIGYNGADRLFGIDMATLTNGSEQELQSKLVGKTITEYAFMSTGDAKGKGFTQHPIIMNVYSPAGTKMIYLEPVSYYGSNYGPSWDGKTRPRVFGDEAEVLLQQGTQMRITKLERSGGKIYVDCEVVNQLPPQRWVK